MPIQRKPVEPSPVGLFIVVGLGVFEFVAILLSLAALHGH